MAIKSIEVKAKPFKFAVGDKLFTCDMFGSMSVTVVSPVETTKHGIELVKVFVDDGLYGSKGRVTEIFPGDMGVPGFAYDNRPCSLFRTKQAADAHKGKYVEWLDNSPRYSDAWW